MYKRPNPEDRGLGADHRKLRKDLQKPSGEPCPYCGKPMFDTQQLDLDHVVPRALGGADGPVRWSHRSCNRRAGAVLGLRLRRRRGPIRSREW